MAAPLAQLDLAFCVDLTNSMSPFIAAARQRMAEVLASLVDEKVDLQVGLIGYRDYGRNVRTHAMEAHPLTDDVAGFRSVLDALKVKSPRENSDAAEAVFAGVLATIDLTWRPRATRIIVLVGDAPPHSCGSDAGPYPDRFQDDPTGLSLLEVGARVEAAGITLNALGMVPSVTPMYDRIVAESFTSLARTTGGVYHDAHSPGAAMNVVSEISGELSRQIGLEQLVWEALESRRQDDPELSLRAIVDRDHAQLERELGATADEIYGAIARLHKRGY